eukprot:1349519-Amorphochlora_amoeboformis.AAC.1
MKKQNGPVTVTVTVTVSVTISVTVKAYYGDIYMKENDWYCYSFGYRYNFGYRCSYYGDIPRREQERRNLKQLVGTALVRLSEME